MRCVTRAEQREALAAGARQLAAEGLVLGTAGNVSMRAGDELLVTPTGASLATLSAEQVAIVDLEGRALDGGLAPTSELRLHLDLYERRAAGAVIHTHSPFATALACVEELDEVPLVHYGMLELGGTLRVARYATFGTPELADSVAAALEPDRCAALLASHGAVCFAPDLSRALDLAALVEWCCGVYWRASVLGTPREMDDGELAEAREAMARRAYGATRPA